MCWGGADLLPQQGSDTHLEPILSSLPSFNQPQRVTLLHSAQPLAETCHSVSFSRSSRAILCSFLYFCLCWYFSYICCAVVFSVHCLQVKPPTFHWNSQFCCLFVCFFGEFPRVNKSVFLCYIPKVCCHVSSHLVLWTKSLEKFPAVNHFTLTLSRQ